MKKLEVTTIQTTSIRFHFSFILVFFSAKVQGREQYDFILLRFSTPAFPAGFSLFQ